MAIGNDNRHITLGCHSSETALEIIKINTGGIMSFSFRFLMTAVIAVTLSACSTVYRPTAWFAYDYTKTYAIPYTMTTDDVEAACTMTGAMFPAMMSFTELTSDPDKIAISMNMLMGSCSEHTAIEEVLNYARALKSQDINEAKDARIREKRAYAKTTARQYAAYQHMVAEFGEPGGEKCPKLKKKDEIYWMMGNLSGLQAVMSDLKSQTTVNVPKDIAMKAVRGMQCLDAERWWGLPQALEAGFWVMMPERAPEGVDPWETLQQAADMATESGVRLTHAIQVVMADSAGDTERLKAAIRQHAESLETTESTPKYRLIDVMATRQIQAISDRLWTEATGSRTPMGELGTFWDDVKTPATNFDIDDLLGE